jgi:hypothetical protein
MFFNWNILNMNYYSFVTNPPTTGTNGLQLLIFKKTFFYIMQYTIWLSICFFAMLHWCAPLLKTYIFPIVEMQKHFLIGFLFIGQRPFMVHWYCQKKKEKKKHKFRNWKLIDEIWTRILTNLTLPCFSLWFSWEETFS